MSHNFHYNWLLKHVAIPAVSNTTTEGKDLQKFGRKVFGQKFHGIYMVDEIPDDFNTTYPYGIINLDTAYDKDGKENEGTHWIAVAYQGRGRLLVYDSFGKLHQTPKQLIAKYGKSRVTNPDAEQGLREKNCGARCLAWLMMVEIFPKEAAMI